MAVPARWSASVLPGRESRRAWRRRCAEFDKAVAEAVRERAAGAAQVRRRHLRAVP